MPFESGVSDDPIILLPILIEGRRRVETSWWRRSDGSPSPPIDGHCAVLSISRQNVGVLTEPALRVLALAVYGSDDLIGIQPWNDAATKEEVLAVFDRAIAALLAAIATGTLYK